MKYKFMCVFIMIVFSSDLYALTAKEIIEKSDSIMQGTTQVSLNTITIKTKRWTRSMELKSYMIRKEKKSFSEILSPKKDAGNRFLLIDNLMWHYVPKIAKTIKITPSMMMQSWMGSDFTNDDIVKESSIIHDYTHEIESEETRNGLECYKILLTPKENVAVVWGKLIYYVKKNDLLAVSVEYYNEHGVLKKQLDYSDYKKMDDRVIPTKMKMQTIGKIDKYTLMEINAVLFDKPIPDSFFTLQNLKRK